MFLKIALHVLVVILKLLQCQTLLFGSQMSKEVRRGTDGPFQALTQPLRVMKN